MKWERKMENLRYSPLPLLKAVPKLWTNRVSSMKGRMIYFHFDDLICSGQNSK